MNLFKKFEKKNTENLNQEKSKKYLKNIAKKKVATLFILIILGKLYN